MAITATIMIHPTAVIDEGARIGDRTRIWHFCHVSSTAVIGNNCTLGQNVYVGPCVHIGDNVKIQNNVSVYEGVTIEDNVFIGPSVVFTNTKHPWIGTVPKYQKTLIQEGASIGAGVVILPGIVIGQRALAGAGSVVTKDVAAYTTVVGNPARIMVKK